jgi:hypothetical protein
MMMMMCHISEAFGFFPCGPTWFVCVLGVFLTLYVFSLFFIFLGQMGEIPIGFLVL